MKLIVNIGAALMALIGIIWILQGVNILPGSFMTGDPKWAFIGGLFLVMAVGAFLYNNRRRPSP